MDQIELEIGIYNTCYEMAQHYKLDDDTAHHEADMCLRLLLARQDEFEDATGIDIANVIIEEFHKYLKQW